MNEGNDFLLLAYLDPGTGSLLFSLILGLITTSYFVVRTGYEKVSMRVLGVFGKEKRQWNKFRPLVLFSDGKQYYSSFKPLLDELARRRLPCSYLSTDPQDPILQLDGELVDARCLGTGPIAWATLSRLQAKVCLTTTPGLDVLAFKRSKTTAKYIHFVHSPTDKAFNKPFSFDYFDTVVLNGPHQVRTLSYLEKLRGTRAKRLPMLGCVYYDHLVEKRDRMLKAVSKKRGLSVLVAPTWGKNGLLSRFGEKVLRPLLDKGFNVTLRPHPQSYMSEKPLLEFLRKQLAGYQNFHWDDGSDAMESMAHSDVMVSDISGVVFDYAFLFEKPVISIQFAPELRGTEANDLPYQPWELTVLNSIGRQVDEADIGSLPEIVPAMLNNTKQRAIIQQLRDEYVANFGNAAVHIIDEVEMALAAEEVLKA